MSTEQSTAPTQTPAPRSPLFLQVVAAVAIAGAVTSAFLWQKLSNIQEQLARQSAEAGGQASQARDTAKQAQELALETAAKLAVTEARLGEVSLQRTQLEELMQSLSRSRDENLVVDIESAVRIAQQQAQLAGSVEPLLAALKSAELRVTRAAQPRLTPLLRAIAKDIGRIKGTAMSDTPSRLL
jgi:uroporphyrin-3 C-methyltransferase